MIKWSSRRFTYKFALVCSYLVFLVYAAGFSVPMWLGNDPHILGLWMEGVGNGTAIEHAEATFFNEGTLATVWFDIVRGLMLGGMAFYVLAVLVSVVENCFVSSTAKDYAVSGVLTLFAGLCGCAAVVVTAVKAEDDKSLAESYRFGFIMTAVASALAIVLSIVLISTRKTGKEDENKSSRTADYVYAHNKNLVYVPEYNNPGYRGDDLPLVNGAPPYGPSPYNMYRPGSEPSYPAKHELQGNGYNPYGYKEPARPGNRMSLSEGADLSNGYTPGMIQSDHSLGRRGEYPRPQYSGGELFYNGVRPY